MSDKRLPEVGTLARDAKTGRVGQVIGHMGPYVQMRPPHGGAEWHARPEDGRPAGDRERLRACITRPVTPAGHPAVARFGRRCMGGPEPRMIRETP
nr:hypothetical protein [Streptomyces spiramyceticus]